jgi:hypothetical protein
VLLFVVALSGCGSAAQHESRAHRLAQLERQIRANIEKLQVGSWGHLLSTRREHYASQSVGLPLLVRCGHLVAKHDVTAFTRMR